MTTLTHHGGRIDDAAKLYPDAPRPWVDLSTGINPTAWQSPPSIQINWSRLPSPADLMDLEASAAAFFGAPASAVVAVPGTEIALRLLSRLRLPAPFHHISPGYRTHAAAFPDATPIAVSEIPASRGTVLLANPNNPDGDVLDPKSLHALAGERWMIVDEAFADCDADVSIIPQLPAQAIVLRSFGKFFGLAGVRLGFVIGPDSIVRQIRLMLGDWPVSAAAIAFGTLAYRDTAWIAATRRRLVIDADKLDTVLRRHGLNPIGRCPLFRLLIDAPTLFDRLARVGILTRPFDYASHWLRIGLPADAGTLARLDRALDDG